MNSDQITVISKDKTNAIYNYLKPYTYVYIYGRSGGHKLYRYFKTLQIKIDGIAVIFAEEGNDRIGGLKVVSIDKMTQTALDDSVFIIGVSILYEDDVVRTLQRYGVKHILRVELEGTEGPDNINRDRVFPKLEITAQIGCDIQCKFCPQQVLYSSYFYQNVSRKKEMSFDDYKKCLSHMPKETIINFAGFVEPFLHKDAVKMILYAFEKGFDVELFTTFKGLSYENFRSIRDLPFSLVVLHTPDKMNYAKIPINEEYIRILDEALDLKKEDGLPFIDSANCQSEPSEEFLKISKGRVLVMSQLHDRAGNLDGDQFIKSKYKSDSIFCIKTRNLDHWVVLPDGTLTLCCMDFGLKHKMGNLLENTYEEIITAFPWQNLRKSMLEGGDILCRKCFLSRNIDGI